MVLSRSSLAGNLATGSVAFGLDPYTLHTLRGGIPD